MAGAKLPKNSPLALLGKLLLRLLAVKQRVSAAITKGLRCLSLIFFLRLRLLFLFDLSASNTGA